MLKILITLLAFAIVTNVILAQNADNTQTYHTLNSTQHTSIRDFNPYAHRTLTDSLVQSLQMESNFAQNTWLGRKFFNEDLVDIKNEDYNIILNPLLDLSIGDDNNLEDLTYVNRRGVQVRGNITDKFSFYTDFLETQTRLPKYIDDVANERRVIPGQGIFKKFGDKGGKDYGIAQGYLDYQPNKYFGFQFGRGKNFIGDGYRSFLLSDNAFNYPYLKLTVNIWKLKYMVLYTQMKDINNRYSDGTFINKYVTAHYLSFNVNKRWNIGFYESVTYGDADGTRGYDLSYLNPIIFYRPVEFALGSSGGNVILGFNTKLKLTNNIHTYGQVSLDELNTKKLSEGDDWWANKFAWQIGFRSFNTFIPNLTIQSELNLARPFIYSHTNELQSFTQYNESLTHPLGSNFIESITRISYRYERLFANLQFIYSQKGLNRIDQNLGSDILISNSTRFQEFNNTFLQGDLATTNYIDAKVGYIINPNYNLLLQIGITKRSYIVENQVNAALNTTHIYFGLKTDLYQYYYDF